MTYPDKLHARRRTVLRGIGGAVVAGGALSGHVTAVNGCDETVSDGESIQAAIDAATPGQTICVESGTYVEEVTVNVEGLTLAGPNAGTAGADAGRGPEATIEGQVIVSADDATLSGVEVSPPPATSTGTSEAVRVSNVPDGVTVRDCVVRDFERDDHEDRDSFYGVDGINLFGGERSGTDPITDVTVTRNLVRNLRNEVRAGAAGISVQGYVVGADVTDNVVRDVGEEVTDYGFGVVIRGTGNNNQLPSDVSVTGNTLTNVLSDPSSDFYGVGFEVEGDGTGYTASGNLIVNNDLGIEVKVAADETTITGNDVAGNSFRGALNTDSATLDATNNWWGAASGPGGPDGRRNPAGKEVGKGDDIEGDVAFEPWLRRSITSPSRR